MNFSRRGSMRSAGLIVVAVLAVLALVLIILKFKDSSPGPQVSAVPLTGPQTQRLANDSSTGAAPSKANKEITGAIIAKKTAVQQADRDMEIQVVDSASKQPLPGVDLSINMQGAGNRKDRTEAAGKAWLMLPPQDPQYLSIQARLDGYVKKSADWRGGALPATYVMEMERGTSIGGVVKDEQGNPVKGASVSLLFPGDAAGARGGMYQTEGPFITDEEGKWRCDTVPADLTNLSMQLSHKEFISDEHYGASPRPADAELRALTAVSVLKHGIAVAGVVLDDQGKPIAGASVAQGADRFGSNFPKIKTDEEGKFRFGNARPGPLVLTVQAKNYAPELKDITVAAAMPELEFRLGPAKTVRGKVVDEKGKPVGGAFVAADTWRGHRSLEWRVNTKNDGSFLWTGAPADEVLIDLGKQGFQSLRHFHLVASDKEVLITLRKPQKISGSVVDDQTGQPIEKFKVVTGIKWQDTGQPIYWDDRSAQSGADGQYQVTFDEPYPQRAVRVEALGYIPAISPLLKQDAGDVVFDVRLKKGTGPTGIVRLPDGNPAPGTDVLLCTPGSQASLHNGKIDARMNQGAAVVKTGADGRFEFLPQLENFLIIAVQDEGYAEVTQDAFKASTDIKLQPWGKIEGKLMIGSKPGASQTINLSYNRPFDEKAPRYFVQYEATTDKDGNFSFAQVVPGEIQVSRSLMQHLPGGVMTSAYTHTSWVTVKAGETAKVALGGTGRPIVGKINLPPDAAIKGWTFTNSGMNTKQSEPKYPDGWDDFTPEQQQEWWKKRTESDEYKKQLRTIHNYSLVIDPDGKFRADDVEPGAYQLYIMMSEPMHPTKGWGEPVASANKVVVVPEIPGGRTDEPLDIGTLDMMVMKKLNAGDPAPEIAGPTFDGKPFKLSEQKGKYVLLEFWGRGTQPTDLATLKEINDAFGKDDRLVIVGLNFERKLEVGKKYADDNGVKWTQVFLGQKSTVPQDYQYRVWPSSWLIGPDGKIVAKDVPVAQVKGELEKALKK